MKNIERLDPAHLALVLVDLQQGYCKPGSDWEKNIGGDVSGAEQVCRDHVAFLEAARDMFPSRRIIWFQMEEAANTLAPNMHYGAHLGDKIFAPLCVRKTEGHKFHIVEPEPGEPVFLKFHMSGFSNRDFIAHLEKNGITQLAFTGVIESRCVNATILGASERGYECIALRDLMGGPADLAAEMAEHRKVTDFFYSLPLQSGDFIARVRKARAVSQNRL